MTKVNGTMTKQEKLVVITKVVMKLTDPNGH
jgi:hypothetical protein